MIKAGFTYGLVWAAAQFPKTGGASIISTSFNIDIGGGGGGGVSNIRNEGPQIILVKGPLKA